MHCLQALSTTLVVASPIALATPAATPTSLNPRGGCSVACLTAVVQSYSDSSCGNKAGVPVTLRKGYAGGTTGLCSKLNGGQTINSLVIQDLSNLSNSGTCYLEVYDDYQCFGKVNARLGPLEDGTNTSSSVLELLGRGPR